MNTVNYIYTFKTKLELIEEFGENWVQKTASLLSSFLEKNQLFGKKINNIKYYYTNGIRMEYNNVYHYIPKEMYNKTIVTDYKFFYKTLEELITDGVNQSYSLGNGDTIEKFLTNRKLYGKEITDITRYHDDKLEVKIGFMYFFIPQKIYKKVHESDVKYKCFIKTEKELIKQYGEDWKNTILSFGWTISMDKLFGKEIKNYKIDDNGNLKFKDEIYIHSFPISIYNKISYIDTEIKQQNMNKYVIKTESEFIKEYGKNWRTLTKNYFSVNMDFLFGKELDNSEKMLDGKTIIYRDSSNVLYYLSDDMYNTISGDTPTEKVKNFKKGYVVKSKEECISHFSNSMNMDWLNHMIDCNVFGKTLFDVEEAQNFLIIRKEGTSRHYYLHKTMYDVVNVEVENDPTNSTFEQYLDQHKNNSTDSTDSYEYYVKTEALFILEFGILTWRTSLTKKWFDDMDVLFGKKLENITELNDNIQYQLPDGKFVYLSNDMIRKAKKTTPSNELDTRVELKIIQGQKTFMVHCWLQGKVQWDKVTSKFNDPQMKYTMMGMYGQDYKMQLLSIVFSSAKPSTENFGYLNTDSTITNSIIKTEPTVNTPKQETNLEDLTDKELLNMKDRIDEILFKRKFDFTDDEYALYLENEDLMKPEEVKDFMVLYKSDKFKLKKNRIRFKLEELNILSTK